MDLSPDRPRLMGPPKTIELKAGFRVAVDVAWWVVAVPMLAIFVVSIPGYWRGWIGPVAGVASMTGALLSLGLSALLRARKPHDPMALYLSFYLLLYAVVMSGPLESALFVLGYPIALAAAAQMVVFCTPTVVLLTVFPNGRFAPRWTVGLVLSSLVVYVAMPFTPVDGWMTLDHRYAQSVSVFMGVLTIACLAAQVYRYHRISTPAERKQTRLALAGLVGWVVAIFVSSIFYVQLNTWPAGRPLPWWGPLSGALWWLGLCILPFSLSIAVLRARLFDIDVIIRRTLVYAALTGTLALFYFGGIVLLQQVFRAVTGQQSELAVVISTLAIAGLFGPLRRRIQDVVDRRFYRRKYDAARILAGFGKTLRDEVDLNVLSGRLLAVVEETVQPAQVSLWLVKEGARREL